MPHVYLLHFDPPYKHAQHYVGYTGRDQVNDRLVEHQTGKGAVLTQAAVKAGCTITLARVWSDVPRKYELTLKGRGLKPICPICKARSKSAAQSAELSTGALSESSFSCL